MISAAITLQKWKGIFPGSTKGKACYSEGVAHSSYAGSFQHAGVGVRSTLAARAWRVPRKGSSTAPGRSASTWPAFFFDVSLTQVLKHPLYADGAFTHVWRIRGASMTQQQQDALGLVALSASLPRAQESSLHYTLMTTHVNALSDLSGHVGSTNCKPRVSG